MKDRRLDGWRVQFPRLGSRVFCSKRCVARPFCFSALITAAMLSPADSLDHDISLLHVQRGLEVSRDAGVCAVPVFGACGFTNSEEDASGRWRTCSHPGRIIPQPRLLSPAPNPAISKQGAGERTLCMSRVSLINQGAAIIAPKAPVASDRDV